ncbi:uncharacterized protein FIBRA_07303 [Fibroporia radiculosa]|uniref:Uncharacterized protein n=1 Tax=Fibroporia radiculosa TaxID=599839 RepID=J4IBR0_9APHY|nr:uncharacterized protein FIBRA_07303 [Fibroporia radiculosa]CCM05096.1 predicted protein [Fibroporia radiculosa]
MSVLATTTPKQVLSTIHNIPKRMKSANTSDSNHRRGKENIPPGEKPSMSSAHLPSSPSCPAPIVRPNWQAKDGMIIIKVSVPFLDDLWKFKVPEDVTLETFLLRVEEKVGFPLTLSKKSGQHRERPVSTEAAFVSWVSARIDPKTGRNTPLVAHVRL